MLFENFAPHRVCQVKPFLCHAEAASQFPPPMPSIRARPLPDPVQSHSVVRISLRSGSNLLLHGPNARYQPFQAVRESQTLQRFCARAWHSATSRSYEGAHFLPAVSLLSTHSSQRCSSGNDPGSTNGDNAGNSPIHRAIVFHIYSVWFPTSGQGR